jgi:mono/diheme cytochrome c family protein
MKVRWGTAFIFPAACAAIGTIAVSVHTVPAVAVAQTAAAAPAGQALYAKSGCESCHGAGGGGTASAPGLATTTRTLAAFVAYTRNPTGKMPPHTPAMVSDAALADIHSYLQGHPAGGTQAAVPAGRVESGAALYRKTGCYQCHADEGQGSVHGPRLGPNPVAYARFSSYVRNPSAQMPPYTAVVLSDQDMADIYAFLAARPRPPAIERIPLLVP